MTSGLARVAVAAPNELAASAGTRLAAEGGNAVDAALAAALVTMATEPGLVSLASGGYVCVQPDNGADPVTIDGWVSVPGRGLSAQQIHDRADDGVRPSSWEVSTGYGGGTVMTVGPGSVAVPGTLRALDLAHRRFGRAPWQEVTLPAIESARAGFPLSRATHYYLTYVHESIFGWHPHSHAVLHDGAGTLLARGATVRVPHLADTLEQIAAEGANAFYAGEVARAITAETEAGGGTLTAADLAAYQAVPRPALEVRPSGWRLATNPAPAAGGVGLAALLALLDGRPTGGGWSPDDLRHLVRSQHQVLGFGVGRPDDEAGRSAAARRLLAQTLRSASTAHVSVVDDRGGACALTVSSGYCSGVLAPGTGIWLNNCLGEQELVPGLGRGLPPGTRLNSNMAPTVGRRDADGAALAIGSPGSDRIVSALAQVLALYVSAGLDLAAAVAHPRLHVRVRPDDDPPVLVDHEEDLSLPPGLGLPTRPMSPHSMYFGGVGAAVWSPGEGLVAAGDPRRTGAVAVTAPHPAIRQL